MELGTLEKRKQFIYASKKLYFKEPLEVTKASGTRVWDVKGKEYLDAIGGIVTISVGHNHPRIKNVMQNLLNEDHPQHISSLFLSPICQRLQDFYARILKVTEEFTLLTLDQRRMKSLALRRESTRVRS